MSERDTVIRNGRVQGGLQPTRAFGDAVYKWTNAQAAQYVAAYIRIVFFFFFWLIIMFLKNRRGFPSRRRKTSSRPTLELYASLCDCAA